MNSAASAAPACHASGIGRKVEEPDISQVMVEDAKMPFMITKAQKRSYERSAMMTTRSVK
jgi:hypothetical protein